jgi:S-adenosylmethionine hydrolase
MGPIRGSSSGIGDAAGLSSRRPLVTLTSDFGFGSPYVAAMKATVLRECPDARLLDVSHEVPAFDWAAGAFLLWAGTRHFSPGAVHLAVVDPGVGTERPAVAMELAGSFYVAPDNGLLSLVVEEAAPATPAVVRLRRPAGVSPTFDGRDVFAPAAARLAAGTPLGELGESVDGLAGPSMRGLSRVLWVDRFGNLVTSLRPPVQGLRVASWEIRRQARTYAEAPLEEPFWYVGSMGLVEVALRQARADQALAASAGTPVEPL